MKIDVYATGRVRVSFYYYFRSSSSSDKLRGSRVGIVRSYKTKPYLSRTRVSIPSLFLFIFFFLGFLYNIRTHMTDRKWDWTHNRTGAWTYYRRLNATAKARPNDNDNILIVRFLLLSFYEERKTVANNITDERHTYRTSVFHWKPLASRWAFLFFFTIRAERCECIGFTTTVTLWQKYFDPIKIWKRTFSCEIYRASMGGRTAR